MVTPEVTEAPYRGSGPLLGRATPPFAQAERLDVELDREGHGAIAVLKPSSAGGEESTHHPPWWLVWFQITASTLPHSATAVRTATNQFRSR